MSSAKWPVTLRADAEEMLFQFVAFLLPLISLPVSPIPLSPSPFSVRPSKALFARAIP